MPRARHHIQLKEKLLQQGVLYEECPDLRSSAGDIRYSRSSTPPRSPAFTPPIGSNFFQLLSHPEPWMARRGLARLSDALPAVDRKARPGGEGRQIAHEVEHGPDDLRGIAGAF